MPLVRGYVTLDKYITGRTLREMESLLGFGSGKLSAGAQIYVLTRMPTNAEFEFAGYSHLKPMPLEGTHQVAKQLSSSGYRGEDVERLKDIVRKDVWSLSGPNRLVKVPSVIDFGTYISGSGVPQWKLTNDLPAIRVASLPNYNDRYS